MNFPEIVTFRITARCNYNCKHCFAIKNIKELELPKLKKIFKLLHKKNVKAIALTGGEPLIREDISQIFKELRKYKFKVFLDTNGSFFFKHKDLVDKNVDVLALPIDFIGLSYREKEHFDTIIKILNYYKNKEKRPIIRIGTVVTKDNYRSLIKIGKVLINYPISIWKIYEFLPQNINAIKNKNFLEISSQEFEEAIKELKDKFSNFFEVVISRRKDMNKAYFFINPDGTVFMPSDDQDICREITIGDIFDKNIAEKWDEFVSKDNYIRNAEKTFNYKFFKKK